MSPTLRRISLYWLLLLVPTLAVGIGSILLLRREQARIDLQSAYAAEAREAAAAARARLIVETVELLVGDVETGLLDVLAAEPARGLDAFLDELEKTNPLVRNTFRAAPDGRILHPDARTASGEARGFLRRMATHFGPRPPWLPLAPSASPSLGQQQREEEKSLDESVVRKEVAANVAQARSARRDVQELFKNPSGSVASNAAGPAQGLADRFVAAGDASGRQERAGRTRDGETTADGVAAPLSRPASAAASAAGPASTPASAPASVSAPASALTPTGANAASSGAAPSTAASPGKRVGESSRAPARRGPPDPSRAAPAQAPASAAKSPAGEGGADRRGWSAAVVEGRLQLFGWVQPAGTGEIRGVEVELAALVSRFGGALPAEPGEGEGYALRDDQGRVLHQVGALQEAREPAIRVPFAAALLPGWDVTAHVTTGALQSGNGGGLFAASVVLVAIFVASILAGGSLLFRQARRSEEEAAQKTSFVANVSHEFKTPLTTIRLYSELLEQGRVRDPAQGSEYLRTIGRETQRLARLVNNALDFSRLEQGKKKYAQESVDLVAELARLLDTHGPRVAEAGLALRRELPAAPVVVMTDRDALEQIVLNLIDNACKYASEGGEVMVSLQPRPGGGANVRVADRGPGVPLEHRERIFEKFHRIDDALTAERTGAGLGLSIARQLARGLGGELRYTPRAGAGAEFVLELP